MNLNSEQYKQLWEQAKAFARDAIKTAFERLPGTDGVAREQFAVEFALSKLESVDQSLPVIGKFMDLPLVDWAEREAVKQLVRALVRREYAAMQITALLGRPITQPVEGPVAESKEENA